MRRKKETHIIFLLVHPRPVRALSVLHAFLDELFVGLGEIAAVEFDAFFAVNDGGCEIIAADGEGGG